MYFGSIVDGRFPNQNASVTSDFFPSDHSPGASSHAERGRAFCHHRCPSEGGGAGFGPHSGAWGPPEHLTVLH